MVISVIFHSLMIKYSGTESKSEAKRFGTLVGANYRAACRAKSTADFISKMGTVEEEADESLYWMELLIEAKIVKPAKLESLMNEADELLAITVVSINTAKKRGRKK